MESTLVNIKRSKGVIIPYEYNYYLSISLYSKLRLYQENIKKLHTKTQPGMHTFSNIISKASKGGVNGLDINEGFFIFRSVDPSLNMYLRLGLSIDPIIRIGDVSYLVSSAKSISDKLLDQEEVNFKSLSPVLVRNFKERNIFLNFPDDLETNLNLVSKWVLKETYNFSENDLDSLRIIITSAKRRTVKISNSKNKESITTAFQLKGSIRGTPEALKVLYYKGIGSKTSLGLGCWEVD